jgi:hypothetical protein
MFEIQELAMSKSKKENSLQETVNEFLANNEELTKALNLFKVTNEQYQSALEPLRRPEVFVTNSTNEAA